MKEYLKEKHITNPSVKQLLDICNTLKLPHNYINEDDFNSAYKNKQMNKKQRKVQFKIIFKIFFKPLSKLFELTNLEYPD